MSKTGSVVKTNIMDDQDQPDRKHSHKPIATTVTARKFFRAQNPKWVKSDNLELSNEMAKAFRAGKITHIHPSKKNKSQYIEFRQSGGAAFAAIYFDSYVLVVGCRGTVRLSGEPHRSEHETESGQQNLRSAASREDGINSLRGDYLGDSILHDIFIGMPAMDRKTEKMLQEYLDKHGIKKRVGDISESDIQDLLSKMRGHSSSSGSNMASQMAFTMLREDQRGQLTREPGLLNDRPGNLSVPFAFPLEFPVKK